ncbi:glycosyltransferase involved in cell wall biosynthesis [Spirosoma lacussanchae]|uniref:glycosyltransferase family 2 protein n=1 Tax=Spirosoma lacussanchae TaxID=1884249 RepID=UPI0011093188|nr:glycosyltransferase [Spirosoma lacussanchae]
MSSVRCSVVIPTYQRLPLLNRCLDALSQQTLSTDAFEVIVVDDGNQLAVAEAIMAFCRRTGIQTHYLGQRTRRGPAAARNRGWLSARAPIVAFTDDDCLPQPDWLSAALAQFDQGVTVVTGRLQMPLPDQPTYHDRTTAFLETAEFITANCFCRKSALDQVGGFEESFAIAWREDSDLQFKLLQAGHVPSPCPEAVVIHPMRPAPWYAPLRDERKNQYDALLFKRHPQLFRQRIPAYRGLVVRYYATVLGGTVGVLGLLLGHTATALAGWGSWLILGGWLVAERWPAEPTQARIRQTVLTALATPFLSIYWRLYGAIKYRVAYF